MSTLAAAGAPVQADTFLSEPDAQQAAHELAGQMGHRLTEWAPYGAASLKTVCADCGAIARVPYSSRRGVYLRPEGPAVNPRTGSCSQQASLYSPSRRVRPQM